jgi:hypothetical protein
MKRLIGHISIVQEQRFRLLTDEGRGFLLTLDKNSSFDAADLQRMKKQHCRVVLEYIGEANTISGVATSLRVTDH